MPQLKERPDEQKYPELEGLADFERRSEGKKIVEEADEAILSSDDPKEILIIYEVARGKIWALYRDSKFWDRDVPRFESALANITRIRAEVGRKIKLLPNLDSRGSNVDWTELKDGERKNQAVEIFEKAKMEVLKCQDKKLLQDIYQETQQEWQKLYLPSDSKLIDLDKLKLELGHLILKRSGQL